MSFYNIFSRLLRRGAPGGEDPNVINVDGLPLALKGVIEHSLDKAKQNYPSLADRLVDCGWIEIQPIRWEVCKCLLFGLPQAAITLTNFYVEALLKDALVVHHQDLSIRDTGMPLVDELNASFVKGKKEFGKKNLKQTIAAAHDAGLISDAEKKQLELIRERFRNAYSHADKWKIFGDTTVPTTAIRLGKTGFEIHETVEASAAESFIGQGIMQFEAADANALDYFKLIDDIALRIIRKLFPNLAPRARIAS